MTILCLKILFVDWNMVIIYLVAVVLRYIDYVVESMVDFMVISMEIMVVVIEPVFKLNILFALLGLAD